MQQQQQADDGRRQEWHAAGDQQPAQNLAEQPEGDQGGQGLGVRNGEAVALQDIDQTQKRQTISASLRSAGFSGCSRLADVAACRQEQALFGNALYGTPASLLRASSKPQSLRCLRWWTADVSAQPLKLFALANERFVSNAPEEVVAKERDRQAEHQSKVSELSAQVAKLAALA